MGKVLLCSKSAAATITADALKPGCQLQVVDGLLADQPHYLKLQTERVSVLKAEAAALDAQLKQAYADAPNSPETKELVTKLWHIARRMGISGSNASVVMGDNTYRSRLDLFNELTGRVDSNNRKQTSAQEWGHRLEPLVVQKFAELHKVKFVSPDTFQSPLFNFMSASIDRFIVNAANEVQAILEIKTASFNYKVLNDDGELVPVWGPGCKYQEVTNEDGTPSLVMTTADTQCPKSYKEQVLHYMLASGVYVARLAVLISGNDYRDYVVPFDEEIAINQIRAVDDFFCRYVLDDVVPEKSADEIRESAVIPDSEVEASKEIEGMVKEVKQLAEKRKVIEDKEKILKDNIVTFMNDKEVLTDGHSVIATLSMTKDRTTFDAKAFQAHDPETYAQFVKTSKGTRRLCFK